MAHEFESGFMVREKAWHGLGTIVAEAPTSADALHLAGLDWRVDAKPIFVDGLEVPGYKANVRDSDNSVLGVVSNRYQIVQNTEAFEFTDQLLGSGVKYETAGSLRNGKTIWLLAKMDSINILGDEIEPYLCFTNSHDGLAPVRACMTDVRVVCNNTLSFALSKAKRVWSVRHTGLISDKIIDARNTLQLAADYNKALSETAEEMVKDKLSANEQTKIISTIFKTDSNMTERQINNINEAKEEFMVCMLAPDLVNFAMTKWQILQAAADYASHKTPKRQTATYQENNWGSLINGNAFLDLTMDVVKSF